MAIKQILLNDQCLYRRGAGVAGYLRCLLANWPAESPVQPVGFCKRGMKLLARRAADGGGPAEVQLAPLSRLGRPRSLGRRPPYWVRRMLGRAYAKRLAAESRRGDYAAVFEPDAIAAATDLPTVTTMHDLSAVEHPQWHPRDRAAWWEAQLGRSIAATGRWLAVSQFTRSRMIDLLGIDPSSIAVTPLAARPLPYPGGNELTQLRSACALPQRYLLHLGTLEPRKNIPVLLDAYAQLPPAFRADCKLILAGGAGWGGKDFWRRLIDHPMAGEVLATGFVNDASAGLLLAAATAVLAPSHYEGFGLPVLEAMAAETPVICSTAEALVETAGGAAELIDPDDAPAWSAAMLRALEDDPWRTQRRQAGIARASEFCWRRTAEAHVREIARLIDAAEGPA